MLYVSRVSNKEGRNNNLSSNMRSLPGKSKGKGRILTQKSHTQNKIKRFTISEGSQLIVISS